MKSDPLLHGDYLINHELSFLWVPTNKKKQLEQWVLNHKSLGLLVHSGKKTPCFSSSFLAVYLQDISKGWKLIGWLQGVILFFFLGRLFFWGGGGVWDVPYKSNAIWFRLFVWLTHLDGASCGLSWNHLPPGQESLPGAVQLFKNLLGSDEFGLHAGQGWSAFWNRWYVWRVDTPDLCFGLLWLHSEDTLQSVSGWWWMKYLFIFTPQNWGNSWSNLTCAYFSNGWVQQPPTSYYIFFFFGSG